MDELLKEALKDSNPWWEGKFFEVTIKPRIAYAEIEKYFEKKQITAVFGLRRTGKSYLVYHLIRKLSQKQDPRSILYFSFDGFKKTTLNELLRTTEELTGIKPRLIFLDEAQKMDDWAEQVKRAYDLGKAKIFITGSEALFLKKTSKESLGGRIFEFEMKPLSFAEYLDFKGIKTDELHYDEIKKTLWHYLLTGGFPELTEETDPFFIRKYLKEGIIDKAVYREIPARFKIEDPSVLEKLLNITIDNPGLLVDKNHLAQELGLFRTTVSKYLFYLESAFLIKSLHNYSANASTSEKKLKKYYPAFSPLGIGLKNDSTYVGKAVETVAVLKTGAKFFWRNPQKDEVDIVLTDPLQPIEVKYREQPEALGIQKFQRKFGTRDALIITKDTEKKQGRLTYVPLWKWLLQ